MLSTPDSTAGKLSTKSQRADEAIWRSDRVIAKYEVCHPAGKVAVARSSASMLAK